VQRGALYDIETLEEGMFAVKCKMTNFKIYQLRTILWILEDINEGLVTFGMGGSRGNGQIRTVSRTEELIYRKYTDDASSIDSEEEEMLFGRQIKIAGLDKTKAALNIHNRDELIGAVKEGR
jgi:hypothetical protein